MKNHRASQSTDLVVAEEGHSPHDLGKVLFDLVTSIPTSGEARSNEPAQRASAIISTATWSAAVLSGGLALPPGPLNLLTILPDLAGIWRLQRGMVADIAACYGQQSALTREVMAYCLFKHAAALLVRDLVVRVGERALVRRVALRSLQSLLKRLGMQVTQRVLGNALSRWIPVVGAVGVGAYSFYDTRNVGRTAVDLFSSEIEIEPTTTHGRGSNSLAVMSQR